ncbi:hypothetical protein [Novipirellula artificiosorum]|uniref:Uncharacterized protein n=1 Tax=Novipirellula artificiosorum TaxID=2528016 RepID=A0A5C6DBW5_9BACT|nr:hypothetical protein [Novipirellula artificiosorum]TWU33344.1 hypothetical protein Poly41_50980 [Novipirellula artificiosorum]
MSNLPPPDAMSDSLRRLAGYLNFSSGSGDPAIFAAWNHVYETASAGDPLRGPAAWLVLRDWLTETLGNLQAEQGAFRDITQAQRVVKILWSDLLPAYLDYHRDLLFHQKPEVLFNGFLLGRAAETMLEVGLSNTDEQLVNETITRLNDYVGYRPVAMLENRRCQPYPHEFVRPIPLYIRGAGVSAGPYHDIVARAIAVLRDTDSEILRAASFDPEKMQELALDPRAFDFDHPVNRRPNYHFGGWDTRSIDGEGFYDRFVLRQVTLDALLSRLQEKGIIDREELLSEAATVLAGTILMASGISGWGPGAYSSDVTLGSLMKPIATYRDEFYEDRLARLTGAHSQRLSEEQRLRRQPFGAVRQHLNAALAERRAAQVQHVQLARLYARMGYPDAAAREVDAVPAASARMLCRIDCEMTLGLRALRAGKPEQALKVPAAAFDLLKRAIECGAIIDPWDILGFGGNFSLFPSPDCSVHDARVDDLLYLIEQLFGYMANVWSEAAARNDEAAYSEMEQQYREIAEWWRQYAAHTIDSIEAADPLESYESAKLVARALRLWHEGGAEAGNVAFWAPHADLFDSPRAYALVISALLDRNDFTPAMALLVHWLNNADRVGLRLGGSSLPRLAERWLLRLRFSLNGGGEEAYVQPALMQTVGKDTREIWPLVRKFFDFLEANAEQFWSAPQFQLGQSSPSRSDRDWDRELSLADEDDGGDEGLFDAAYEDMTYRDTTDDGNEGAVFEFGDDTSHDELETESKRLSEHLSFLKSLSRMWAVAADIAVMDQSDEDLQDRLQSLQAWAGRARENRIGLLELLDSVRRYKITPAGSDKDSMRSYDRHRVLRDSLMERIIGTTVEMSDSRRLVCGALLAHPMATWELVDRDEEMADDDAQSVKMFAALIAGDTSEVRRLFPPFLDAIHDKNLLYIPLARGGDPVKIYVSRLRQRVLRHLLLWLPRRGLIAEACRLIEIARQMEQENPIGVGAVTEFDGLFQVGFRSLVASIVESTRKSVKESTNGLIDERSFAEVLIPLLEQVTEILLASWLAHSQTLRLSPLETVADPKKWKLLVAFIKEYGDPIFTQMFLQLGNVRAILHQGVASWLERVLTEGDDQFSETRLYADLDIGKLQIREAQRWITLVYEALMDHHAEYQDYNSTTTQSDRGDLVYMFLDFLRLRVRYERIAWNLRPVMWAHEVLVRSGFEAAAMMWRRSLSERIGEEAEVYVEKLRKMQKDYAMRMPTVADRILERFVQPMTIDRMRALVGPAMRDAELNHESPSFDLLEQEADLLTRHPTGVGLDVPAWLDALGEEVEQLAKRRVSSEIDPQALITIPIVALSVDDLNDQLVVARSQGRRLPHMR